MTLTSIVIAMHNRTLGMVNTMRDLLFPSLLNNASSEKQLILVDDRSPEWESTKVAVDNFSDSARSRFGDYIHIRFSDNRGFSGSYNLAAKQAEGDTLLICNADVYLPEGTVDKLTSKADGKMVGPVTNSAFGYQCTSYFKPAFGGRHIRDTARKEPLEEANKLLSATMDGQTYPALLSGFCFAIPKEMFGFDESMPTFWSDTDLSRRTPSIVDGSTFVYHHDVDSSSQIGLGSVYKLIRDGLAYSHKHVDVYGTVCDFMKRAGMSMFDIGTVTQKINERSKQ